MPRGVYDRSKIRQADKAPNASIEGAEFDPTAPLVVSEGATSLAGQEWADNGATAVFINPLVTEQHPLEQAPVNSKIVVTPDGAWLAATGTSDGRLVKLPKSDPASRLPPGARIQKQGAHRYVATQLNPAEDHPDTVHETALLAITTFNSHFHNVRAE